MTNTYNITLTEDEARTLLVITGSVLGSENRSPRKHTSSVYGKLNKLLDYDCGIPESNLFGVYSDGQGQYITFKEYPQKTPQQLKIEDLEQSIANAQKQLEELKGLK